MYCLSSSKVENAIPSEVEITTPDTTLWPWVLVLIVELISSANAFYVFSCLTPLLNTFILFQ